MLGELETYLVQLIASSWQMLHRDNYYREVSRHEIPEMSVVRTESNPLVVKTQCAAAVLYVTHVYLWLKHHGYCGQPERVVDFSN